MRFIRVMKGSLPDDQENRREELMRKIFGDEEFERMEKERSELKDQVAQKEAQTQVPNGQPLEEDAVSGDNPPKEENLPPSDESKALIPVNLPVTADSETATIEEVPFDDMGNEPIEAEDATPVNRVKTQEEILAKNTNYIFIFGYTGSGKSTVLTAINMYMRRHYRVILNQTENQEGIRLIHEMMRDIESGSFPQPTSIGNITEYDTAFTMNGEEVNLTFLEMAGEDLKKVDVDEGDDGLSEELLAYLRCPGISISFLLIADYERVMQRVEDKLILQFLSYLYNEGIDMSRVGVVLSKFDKGRTDLDVEEVIKNYLPQVDKWLTSDDIAHPKVFPFSIGSINSHPDRKDDIAAIELEDCGDLVPWLHDVLALPGAKNNRQNVQKESLGNKLRSMLKF